MAELDQLWSRIERYKPIVLTGIPCRSSRPLTPDALGLESTSVNMSRSVAARRKKNAGTRAPGDVLIDDLEKHRHLPGPLRRSRVPSTGLSMRHSACRM
jgi:hypothetical protein